jgi:hypothetical protein
MLNKGNIPVFLTGAVGFISQAAGRIRRIFGFKPAIKIDAAQTGPTIQEDPSQTGPTIQEDPSQTGPTIKKADE